MDIQIPSILIFQGARLQITFEDTNPSNRTSREIMIMGNREGFLSLANTLIFCVNDLVDVIPLHEMQFVTSDFNLLIAVDEANISRGGIVEPNANGFIWSFSEDALCLTATNIHSLGYANPELHLDSDKLFEDISVYCVVG